MDSKQRSMVFVIPVSVCVSHSNFRLQIIRFLTLSSCDREKALPPWVTLKTGFSLTWSKMSQPLRHGLNDPGFLTNVVHTVNVSRTPSTGGVGSQ